MNEKEMELERKKKKIERRKEKNEREYRLKKMAVQIEIM